MSGRLTVSGASRSHLGGLARGTGVGLAGALVAGTAGFLLVVVVAHGLSPNHAGLFYTLTAVFLVAEGLAVLGVDTGLARFLLRLEGEGRRDAIAALVRSALGTTLLCAAVVVGLAAAVAAPLQRALDWDGHAWPLVVLAAALPAAVLCDVMLAATRALGHMGSTVLVDRGLRAVGQLVAAWLALAFGAGVSGAVAAWSLSQFVAAVASVVALERRLASHGARSLRAPGVPPTGLVREFWSFTWLRGLSRVAQLSIQKIDIILVAALLSPAAAAAYTVATRFVPLGQMASAPVQQVLQPRLTAIMVEDNPTTLKEVHQVATAWSVLLAWPLYLGVGALADAYLDLFSRAGSHEPDAPVVVVVMALTMMVAVATGPVDTLLLMAGRSGLSALNTAVALAIDVVGCVLLLPRIGILGAAVAWAAAVLTRAALGVVQVRRETGVTSWSPITLAAGLIPVLCVGLPSLILAVLAPPAPVLWSAVVLIAACYPVVLWRWRGRLGLDELTEKRPRVAVAR